MDVFSSVSIAERSILRMLVRWKWMSAFIQALHRFISVRGSPKKIWSDNGTNFTGAEKELSRSI